MTNDPLRCVVSISGTRGVVGETIDPPTVMSLAAAYGRSVARGGVVVLGRDSRPTGHLLAQAAAAGLRGVGCDVVDIGVVPTPTVPIMIQELSAAGGIQLSASHNPVEWNACKFFNGMGRNIDNSELENILHEYQEPSADLWQRWDGCGSYQEHTGARAIHLKRVLDAVDVQAIRQAKLKVLIDSVNGAGSYFATDLLDALGCEVVPVHTTPDRIFPRNPEPTAANVTDTGAMVAAVGAQVGFIQDPDADRLALIDETGRYIGEEYTLVLSAAARLRAAKAAGNAQPIACTNLSTSRMLEDVAEQIGATVVRTPVGEANVVDGMQREQAVVGGEGNGGVIDPRVVWGRDSHIGIALILELLARQGGALSDAVAGIPAYAIHKEKVQLSREQVAQLQPMLVAHSFAEGAQIDERDGLKLMWPDRWVHLRASGTEPVSRIISEAPTLEEARHIADQVRSITNAEIVADH